MTTYTIVIVVAVVVLPPAAVTMAIVNINIVIRDTLCSRNEVAVILAITTTLVIAAHIDLTVAHVL